MSLRDIIDSLPIIVSSVTVIQSAVVKAGSMLSPIFAKLQAWAKIAVLFVVGVIVYKILGMPWLDSALLSGAGTIAASVIYYFGRRPNIA